MEGIMRYVRIMLPLLIFLFLLPMKLYADSPIGLYLNGKKLIPEVAPRIINESTVVPIRIIAEELGAKVHWDESSRRVKVEHGSIHIVMQIDNPEVLVNGNPAKLAVAPTIVDGSTLLPLRFIGEHLGVKVTWDETTRSVFLYKNEQAETANKEQEKKQENRPEPAQPGMVTVMLPKPEENDKIAGPGEKVASDTGSNPADRKPAGEHPAKSGLPAVHTIVFAAGLLAIEADGPLAPNIFYLSDPDRLVLDLPKTTLGKTLNGSSEPVQNGNIAANHPSIQNIRYALFSSEPSTVRVVIDLKEKLELEPVGNTPPNKLVFSMRKPVPKQKTFKVVVDPGHGGHDNGATTASGRVEKEFTLSVSTKLYKLLKAEPLIEPYITRSEDTYVALADRAAMANNLQADLFVSLHGNSFTNKEIRGVETYYWQPESLGLATIVHRNLLQASGFPDRSVRKGNFKVLRDTVMPAVLLELGYLSNVAEEEQLQKDEVQERIAASIAAAIKEYLQIK